MSLLRRADYRAARRQWKAFRNGFGVKNLLRMPARTMNRMPACTMNSYAVSCAFPYAVFLGILRELACR
jgi:hypothetical protein